MEEILASIRQIISEDDEEVLDLTEAVDDVEDDIMALDDEPEHVAEEPAPEPEPEADLDIVDQEPELEPHQPLVEEPVAEIASGAFTSLERSVRIANEDGMTLDSVVRAMLKPMLKEWLDANLKDIVDAKVEAEIDRISRRGGV